MSLHEFQFFFSGVPCKTCEARQMNQRTYFVFLACLMVSFSRALAYTLRSAVRQHGSRKLGRNINVCTVCCPTRLFSSSPPNPNPNSNLSPEEIKAARDKRKADKEEYKRQKMLKKSSSPSSPSSTPTFNNNIYYSTRWETEQIDSCGDYEIIRSRDDWSKRTFIPIRSIGDENFVGSDVWVRGRLHSIRIKGGSCFLVLRTNAIHTVQCVFFKSKDNENDASMVTYLKTLTRESIIDVQATVTTAAIPVKSTSNSNVELVIKRVHAVDKALAALPFEIDEASKSEQGEFSSLFFHSISLY